MNNITDDIAANVLSRLPIDCLLRFRCVSKSWRGLIDSSHFIKMHLRRTRTVSVNPSSRSEESDLKFIALNDKCMFSALEFDFDPGSSNSSVVANAKQLNYPNNKRGGNLIKLIGSCNGLLCLSNSIGDIHLWNPWIQKYWELPSPPTVYPLGIQVSFRLGFGYVEFNDDYKIVNFLKIFGYETTTDLQDEVYIYSLKLNSWKKIVGEEFIWKFPEEDKPDFGAFANGALHWIVKKKRHLDVNNFIISIDLKNEEFSKQVMTCPRHPHDAFEQHLKILDEKLCVISYYHFAGRYGVGLSVMKEYGVETSWTKIVSIKMPYGILTLWNLTPITYLRNGRGRELVIQIEGHKLVICDPSTNFMEKVRIVGSETSCLASCVCLRTLVQPFGGAAAELQD